MANLTLSNALGSRRAAIWTALAIGGAVAGTALWRRTRQRPLGVALARDRAPELLSNLVATCADAEHGFQTAAEGVTDPAIRSLFRQYADQRRNFRIELNRAAQHVGYPAQPSGSVTGALHHTWMDIKSLVTRGDVRAILAEAERGEDVAVRAYERAMGGGLPRELREIVDRQFGEIRAAHDRIRQLRDQQMGTGAGAV
jgi:uncharacterized protein (TIGR02284 family)